jgi:Mg2+-importing ATPase
MALTVTALVGLSAALALPLLPWQGLFGFERPSGAVIGAIGVLVVGYLVSAELFKRYALRPKA